jgi:aconitate hydratase
MKDSAKLAADIRQTIQMHGKEYTLFSLVALQKEIRKEIHHLPFSIRILLENLLRHADSNMVKMADIDSILSWQADMKNPGSIPFMPARVVLQDFTGVPALVDLAALRSAVARHGGNPETMNPFVPADLVIDHSVQVDRYGDSQALSYNVEKEFERNRERYTMLRWGQKAFTNFRVVPPGTGIVHQVNLEFLAKVVQEAVKENTTVLYPDSVLGTDSHTTMINGIGVLGWGVGGIEAEAVLLGQPYSMQVPEVIGAKLTGNLPRNTTATDLVLFITEFLREIGVVGKFVEFFGAGMSQLSLPDRATIANMAPEYGATMGFFPVNEITLTYLRASGRTRQQIERIKQYCITQQLFHDSSQPEPTYSTVYTIDLSQVEPSLAGPKKPQQRIPLPKVHDAFMSQLTQKISSTDEVQNGGCWDDEGGFCELGGDCSCPLEPEQQLREGSFTKDDKQITIEDGAVVIAAITSCTNTSNPAVMIGAGLLAKKAVELGLQVKPWVKTSMAPGSRVVSQYLDLAGLTAPLQTLGFHIVGYGCTTCIGNSGPLDENISAIIKDKQLLTASVLSGNRNFEARIHPLIHANYLCSPQLVVAYAIAGTVTKNLETEPLGTAADGTPVFLKDIWPGEQEIAEVLTETVTPELFTASYEKIFTGNTDWNTLPAPVSNLFTWDKDSSYIKEPPFFIDFPENPAPLKNIKNARILALFGDTITTDHISPAGAIPVDSPAGKYLQHLGVKPENFNSFGSRRGNHEVMMRGTFGNIRINNLMAGKEGGFTRLMPDDEMMSIFDAAMEYKKRNHQLVIFAGKDYGTGSSRDWAAKGTLLLGVKAVFAESFERIHRSNLVGMGVLPLQLEQGVNQKSLDINGNETISIQGLTDDLKPGSQVAVIIERENNSQQTFHANVRLDNSMEVEYYRHGGILHKALRQILN